jgi:hypothetical protein
MNSFDGVLAPLKDRSLCHPLDSNGLVNSFMLFQLLPCFVNIHRVVWSNLARVVEVRPAPLPPILEVVGEVFLGNEVDLPQIVAGLRIAPDELGRESQEVLSSVRNSRALAESDVDVDIFRPRLPITRMRVSPVTGWTASLRFCSISSMKWL